MADTFNNDLRVREQEAGSNSGTWGDLLNTTISNLASAFGQGSEAIPNASTHTITLADGAADEARSMYLKCTGGGQACTVTLAPNTISKVWIISNETSFTLTFSQGSSANVAVAAGAVKMIVTDGAGSGAAVIDALSGLEGSFSGIDVTGSVTADGGTIDGALSVNTAGNLLTLNATSGVAYQAFKENGTNRFFLGTLNGSDGLAFIDADGTTNRMVIDSSGNVGIGVTPSSWSSAFTALQVEGSSIWSTGSDVALTANNYYDGTQYKYVNNGAASRQYHNTDGSVAWFQAGSGTAGNNISFSQAMTLDSSGNLLVGHTSLNGTGGVDIGTSGYVRASRSGDEAAIFNRETNDGTIVSLQKDGSPVGSISVEGGDLAIGNDDAGIQFVNGTEHFRPFNITTNAATDALMDIGSSSKRFKDLYLSGKASIGNQIIGGFGANDTGGTADWNHSTNARSGMGETLLLGTATNGPGVGSYFHAVSFEYNAKDGTGNMTQLAIGYNTNRIFMRYRYADSWTSWVEK